MGRGPGLVGESRWGAGSGERAACADLDATDTACAAGIAVYLGLAAMGLADGLASMSGMAVIALVRLASIRWGITLPILQLPNDGSRESDGAPRG